MDQNITMDDGITYNMTLYSAIVNETDSASDHVSVTLSFACGRRPYWAFGPVHLYYCNQTSADPDLRDGAFMSDAAHEFGTVLPDGSRQNAQENCRKIYYTFGRFKGGTKIDFFFEKC